jgi:hypothetical protein
MTAEEPAEKEPNWLLRWDTFTSYTRNDNLGRALHQRVNILKDPADFAVGLPYSLGLLYFWALTSLGIILRPATIGFR